MNHYDTDITQTDWSELEQAVSGYMPGADLDNEMVNQNTKCSGRSKAQLKTMFDKFLYQR